MAPNPSNHQSIDCATQEDLESLVGPPRTAAIIISSVDPTPHLGAERRSVHVESYVDYTSRFALNAEGVRMGEIHFRFDDTTKDLEIMRIFVEPEFRKQGVSHSLVLALLEKYNPDSISCELYQTNEEILRMRGLEETPAYRTRHSLGYTEVDHGRSHIGGYGKQVLVMKRP